MLFEYIEDKLYKDAMDVENYEYNSGATLKGEKEKKKTLKEEISEMRSELKSLNNGRR